MDIFAFMFIPLLSFFQQCVLAIPKPPGILDFAFHCQSFSMEFRFSFHSSVAGFVIVRIPRVPKIGSFYVVAFAFSFRFFVFPFHVSLHHSVYWAPVH
jgi:hypothetical protein